MRFDGRQMRGGLRRGWCLVLAAFWGSVTGAQADIIDVFFLAGQSNMSGRVTTGFQPNALDDQVLYYFVSDGPSHVNRNSGGRFTTLKPLDTGYYGPEIAIGRGLVLHGYAPALIKVSDGGVSLARDWDSDSEGRLWRAWVTAVRRALEGLEAMGRDIRLRGFFWLQGESDALTESDAQAYRANFLQMAHNAYVELTVLGYDTSEMRFVTALIRDASGLPFAATVRDAQRESMRSLRLGEWFDTRDLTVFDGLHYTAEALDTIGERFIEGWRRSAPPSVAICAEQDGGVRVRTRGVLEWTDGTGQWTTTPGQGVLSESQFEWRSSPTDETVRWFRARKAR